ncbi:MAG: hypothetical protein HC939_23440 [Pleurocapsa sp. SU_5_0]|nr:hypothetical protein [Pleurocapsa sp. SU_5_0]NJO98875.1 hypothetical protein [Pleurocapsa sp. CRU_1_2]
MTENAIERLKDRQRKKVNPRNASLNIVNDSSTESSQTVNQSDNNDSFTKISQTANESDNNDLLSESNQIASESNNNDLLTESSQTINHSSNNESLTKSNQTVEPIRRTVRLDPKVDEYMDILCKENRVTRETLIEAAILVCSKNQRTLSKVITDAKDRYKDRKHQGELKKLQTMSRKLKGI